MLLRTVCRVIRHPSSSPFVMSMIRKMATIPPPTSCTKTPQINLLRGWPAASLLPADLLKSAANAVLSDPNIYTPGLWYGPDPGYEPLRESIAEWLTQSYLPKQAISSNRIVITGGASQNLGCILNVFTDPEYTRNIWLVAPSYFMAFRIFEDAGFGVDRKMRAVPEDDEGLDIDYLRREIAKSEAEARRQGIQTPKYKPSRTRAKVYKHVIYCVPTFANPSSRTMSLDRRKALVQLAREYDALIVCDDVYDLLRWPANQDAQKSGHESVTTHLPRIVDIDRELDGGAERKDADGFGNACSNGSFSKIAGPGLRCGWVEGTQKFAYGVSQTTADLHSGTSCSGGAPSQLTSTYINHLLSTGELQTHITTVLCPAYASRYNKIMSAITTHLLPLGFTLPQTDRAVIGGYFCWLRLSPSFPETAKTLAYHCLHEENVVIAGGNLFEVPGDSEVGFERFIRLCWSWEEEEWLEDGVARVAEVVKRIMEEGSAGAAGFVVVQRDGGMVDEFK